MEKQKKNQIKKVISWVLILCLVAVLAALPMIAANEEPESGPQASILSTSVEKRDIATAVLGGGTVTAETATAIEIPANVKVKEYLVQNGDLVSEGQPIASVDRVSVMTAITEVQETLEDLREELNDIRNDTDATKVTAIASGTVKAVYAAEDENVQDVMLRDGALAVISLDGLMAVRIQRGTRLAGGDKVCVILPDDTEVEGRVESNLEGVLTVTIEDDDYTAGEKVTVTTEDGDRIGSGELYIHSPWNVVAYSGTISRVRISEGASVSAGQRLFDLENDGHTAQFDSLANRHREYEEMMLDLFKMYQSETILAPHDGLITGVDEDGAYMLSDSGDGWKISLLANGPGGDENSYTNYVGQVTEVGIDGLIIKMNPQEIAVTDYHDLSAVPKNPELMTQITTYMGNAPIYVLTDVKVEGGSETPTPPAVDPEAPTEPAEATEPPAAPETGGETVKEWVQVSPYSIMEGDILLFAGNNSGVVWVIKIGSNVPSYPGGNMPQGGGRPGMGGMPSMGGGMAQPEDDLYAMDKVAIASVTPQETVTISVTVDELDVLRFYVGQTAAVTVEALPGQQFEATVTEISASGENEGGNSKFTVTVTLDKIAEMLPGMSASVSVVLETAEQVTCVPVAALIEKGTETQVYRSYDEETETFGDPVAVTTGVSDGEYVQILSGLEAGETVYYPYYDTLVISNAPEAGMGFPFG